MRSCLIDGEAVCCNERGVASFDKLRHRSHDPEVFLVAFDLLELDGNDLRQPEHRLAADRRGLRYPSDLTDAEWAIVAAMLPPGRHGGRSIDHV